MVLIMILLGCLPELWAVSFPGCGHTLPDVEGRGLACSPSSHVTNRLLLVLIDAHGDDEIDHDVAALALAFLEALINEIELPLAEIRIGSTHKDRAVAYLAAEPQHGRLGHCEIDRDLAVRGRELAFDTVEVDHLAGE